ncbi:MAG: DNA repair protein RecO [Oscillospiraceae bacterium]|nr:DNA repair protein RecO [Oscillospiraceae bacterium]
MYINTTGLILRETEYKESSRILTVLTASEGKITVMAKGAKRRGSKAASVCQHLAYSEMTLCCTKGRWTLSEGRVVELFGGLRDDLELLSLGSYFAELLETLSDEDCPGPELLSLGLNALFALGELKKDPSLVKAAFELRLMCVAGFEPVTEACAVCGDAQPSKPLLSLYSGHIVCGDCLNPEHGETCALCEKSLAAIRYIVSCDPKRLYSFSIDGEAKTRLCRACEAYLLAQTDRGYRTLDYYNSVRTVK